MTEPHAARRTAAWVAAGVILLVLAAVALGHAGPPTVERKFVLVPLATHLRTVRCLLTACAPAGPLLTSLLIDGLGNMLVFAPLGAALAVALAGCRPIRRAVLLGAAVSVAFEFIQIYIPGRVVATDDVLLNAAGTALGAAAAWAAVPALRTTTTRSDSR